MTPTAEERLRAIAMIIERVDDRCLVADGPVSKTRHEMTDNEFRSIYLLASRGLLKPARLSRLVRKFSDNESDR